MSLTTRTHCQYISLPNEAVKTNAIVSSLFPSNVRDRLFNEAAADHSDIEGGGYLQPTKTRLKNFLNDGSRRLDLQHLQDEPEKRLGSPGSPIADLFTETTVLFADIANCKFFSFLRFSQFCHVLYFTFWCTKKKKMFLRVPMHVATVCIVSHRMVQHEGPWSSFHPSRNHLQCF